MDQHGPTEDRGGAAAPSPASVSLPPGLEPIRPLGQGMVAHVHLAREAELQRLVAVKLLRPEVAAEETARRRFEREARSAASLDHPNVVAVHRFGRLADDTPYLVMAYVPGRTLAERLEAEGPLDEVETRSVLAQLASALAAAHRKGIVHRDVRASNVLIEEDTGRVLLTDFGIAAVLDGGRERGPRLTRTGQILGQPRYASPEQLRGIEVTGQADVYSLGVLGYELLTREGPYRASSPREWITAHLTGEPRPVSSIRAGVSRELEELLLRCLAREPAHRPRPGDVARRLQAGRSAGGAAATADGRGGADGLGIRRRRIPQIVTSTLVVGAGLLGLVMGAVDIGRLPQVSVELTVNLVAWALLASGVLAWFHGERGRQEFTPRERWILAALATGCLTVTVYLLAR